MKFRFGLFLVLFGLCAGAHAEEPAKLPVYQTAGAPADPKVAAQWDKYHDHAAATSLLQALVKAYPDRCRLESLGPSYGKREMWVFTVGNLKDGKPELEKPAFWIDGAIHANEIQASEVVLYTAWYMLESYDRNPTIKRLVDEHVFYLMPMMSPDSRDAHMHEPNDTSSPRSGQRPVDDDGDGLVDEDKPDDLDHDGNIAMMRVRDPNGRWKSDPKNPKIMIHADRDERGEYTLIDSEGFDNDGDGQIDEDADGYYDPNRNWPWDWQPSYIQSGAGDYPLSILEDRMVADFIMAHPNIGGGQSYHNAGGMILRPPGAKEANLPPEDDATFIEIGKHGETMLPGYRSIETGKGLYDVRGGELDWLYYMEGAFCFTDELFTAQNYFREKTEGYFGKVEDQQKFEKYLLFGDGFIPWHEVDHPQFGKVEVGGFKKNWVRQPPSFLLEEECHRNMAFTLYHADQLPQVEVQSVTARPLDGGLTEVTAVVANRKLIPTRAQIAVQNKLTPPDRITIEAPGLKVIVGQGSDDVLFRKPREERHHPAELRFDTIGGLRAVYARWIVAGAGPYTVTVRSTKGGVAVGRN